MNENLNLELYTKYPKAENMVEFLTKLGFTKTPKGNWRSKFGIVLLHPTEDPEIMTVRESDGRDYKVDSSDLVRLLLNRCNYLIENNIELLRNCSRLECELILKSLLKTFTNESESNIKLDIIFKNNYGDECRFDTVDPYTYSLRENCWNIFHVQTNVNEYTLYLDMGAMSYEFLERLLPNEEILSCTVKAKGKDGTGSRFIPFMGVGLGNIKVAYEESNK